MPAVHEDDAERAVRAAVAMRDAVAQLNPMFEQEYGMRLALRIGVATGEAVAASRPATDFMVTGEVPNLAARLQSIADPIAVSEETYRLLAALLDAERRSLEIFERIQSQSELGQTLLALGRFKLAETPAEGRHLVEPARAIFDAIGATGWSSEATTVLTSAA